MEALFYSCVADVNKTKLEEDKESTGGSDFPS
jgi:hypothetical protein